MSVKIVIPKDILKIEDLNISEKVLEPFSDVLIEFVNDVSKIILKDKSLKEFPELIALAFWMRKSHVGELKQIFEKELSDKVLIARGIVFHIAPSNVDTIFVYSWFLSLLVGNSNILRISDKENIQTSLLIEVINKVLDVEKFSMLKNTIAVVRYGHEDEVTKYFSLKADVRVIWGGDKTIQHIRTLPIKPTAVELSFADKFSFAIIKSSKILHDNNLNKLIQNFYNDSFWFGQMACSSIRMVVWIGDDKTNENAQKLFWNELDKYINIHQPKDIKSADIVNKLVAQCSIAIQNNVTIPSNNNNPFLHKVLLNSIEDVSHDLHCGTGLFYEIKILSLDDLLTDLTKKYQTLSYYGFSTNELRDTIYKNMPNGIDRVVPIGKSLDFSHVWDGYNLFRSFCREIEIKE